MAIKVERVIKIRVKRAPHPDHIGLIKLDTVDVLKRLPAKVTEKLTAMELAAVIDEVVASFHRGFATMHRQAQPTQAFADRAIDFVDQALKVPDLRADVKVEAERLKKLADGGPVEKKRLLIVDDDTGLRQALVRAFKHDYEVRDAEDGQAAIDVIKGGFIPHVLLSDFDMPRLGGGGLYEALWKVRSGVTAHMIIMSGGTKGKIFAEQNSIPFIDKPASNDVIRAAVRELADMVDDAG